MEEKMKKTILKTWWFWLIIVAIIIVIGITVYLKNNETITLTAEEKKQSILETVNLNQKVTVGKLTYYIQEDWGNRESVDDDATYEYYYPYNDTMLMITISNGDYYVKNTNVENFLDGFISGMNLSDSDFISKNIKQINGYNCGIARYYSYIDNNKYESISYIIANGNEAYVFTFVQKSKLEDKFVNLLESIILKADIIAETAEEKQDRIEKEEIDFKSSCDTYTYEQIARNPEKFKGTNVKLTGEVIQAIYGSTSVDLRVNITKEGTYSTYYTDTIYVVYYPETGEDKILEDDIITIYGTSQGDYTYTSAIGTPVTLPLIYGKYITIEQ